ncbi:MAG: YfiR family protein [Cytophagales bacterium]|nr:YfiR family protein [Cytophagales bacterium]
MKSYKLLLWLVFSLALAPGESKDKLSQDLSKYHALFIGKFIDYIDWPDPGQLTIGVVGNSRVMIELQSTIEKRGKARVKKIAGVADISDCDLLFIPASQSKLFTTLNQASDNKPVLIVTEEESLAFQGAGISFYVEGGKLKFIINKSAVESRNLKVSSNLIGLAKVI